MDKMRQVAFLSVQRACLFGALAVFCLMVGLSDEPRLAFKAGGTVTVLMAVILLYKAREARTQAVPQDRDVAVAARRIRARRKLMHNA